MISKTSGRALNVSSYKYLSNLKDKHVLVNSLAHMSVLQLQRGLRTLNKALYINWTKNYIRVCDAQFVFHRTTTLISSRYDLHGNLYKSQCY